MTATDFLKHQLDDAGYQLSKVLEGMPEEAMDKKLTPDGMTPREALSHLCEAYEAFKAHAKGEKFSWGSYKPASTETPALIAEFESQRGAAVDLALKNPTEQVLKDSNAYIVGHDYYHVGQMCAARLSVEPNWDPYAIYRS